MLRHWFTPPNFPDEEQTRTVHLLHGMLLVISALNLLDLVLLLLFAPETLPTFWVNGLFLAISLLAFWMNRRGQVVAASLITGLTFWALLTLYLAISGGVTSPSFGFLNLSIIIGAILLGARGAIGFGVLSAVTAGALYIAGNNGWLTLAEAPPTAGRLFATQTILFISLAYLMAISGRSVFNSLTRARRGEKTLEGRNQQLQAEIVERERAQHEQRRLATILEATSDLVGIADASGKTLYLNHAGRELVGFPEGADVTSTRVADYYSSEMLHKVLNEAFPIALAEGTWSGEVRLLKRDGSEIPVSQVIIAHKNGAGKIEYTSTIMRDLTERQRAESQRLELALQNERLESFKEFIATISHDIKTPLSVINNSLYLLERHSDPVRKQEQLNIIRQQTTLMDKFIQDLLHLSQLDHSSELARVPLDLNSLLMTIQVRLMPVAEAKSLTIEHNLDEQIPHILGEKQELVRALTNLVENAMHYTPEHGEIRIQTFAQGGGVLTQVKDTGIGITPEALPHIFERFYRSQDAQTMRSGGTGLGLAIVKRIVDMHEGKIEVESTVGAGTCFRVWLPTAHTGSI